MSRDVLPVEFFIRSRLHELGLTEDQFLHRLGYRKLRKGREHLGQLYDGDFSSRMLVQRLSKTLELPTEVIRGVADETGRQIRAAEEAAYRAAFRPHAVILTERKIPQPIFVAALLGVSRLLVVEFDLALPPNTFVSQALDGLTKKLLEFNSRFEATLAPEVIRHRGGLPAFGPPTGFVVNYSPDRADRYDLDGNHEESLDKAKRIGSASYTLRGRPLSEAELNSLFGRR